MGKSNIIPQKKNKKKDNNSRQRQVLTGKHLFITILVLGSFGGIINYAQVDHHFLNVHTEGNISEEKKKKENLTSLIIARTSHTKKKINRKKTRKHIINESIIRLVVPLQVVRRILLRTHWGTHHKKSDNTPCAEAPFGKYNFFFFVSSSISRLNSMTTVIAKVSFSSSFFTIQSFLLNLIEFGENKGHI